MKEMKIMTTIVEKGFQCFKVGGCVRDKLLGIEPHDIDLVTDATPEQLEQLFHTVDVGGRQFGVTVVVIEGETFEVATFREDIGSSDNRHPNAVKFSSIEKDAFRRDFTINALYEDINGHVFDPTGNGLIDMENKRILFCTEKDDESKGAIERIKEDRLRILRAFRFVSTLPNFSMSIYTLLAINEVMKKGNMLSGISQERIGIELKKIMSGKQAHSTLNLMKNMRILDTLLPEIAILDTVHQPFKWHNEGNVWEHTLLTIDNCESEDPIVKFACLLHDVGKTDTLTYKDNGEPTFINHDVVGADIAEKICKRLKFSNKDTMRIKAMVLYHMEIKHIDTMKVHKAWALLQREDIKDIMLVSLADSDAAISTIWKKPLQEVFSKRDILFMLNTPMPKPLVTGKDLISIGMKPNITFTKKLGTAYKVQLNCGWNKETIMKQIKSW